MENSKIEWTNHSFNPWRGCTRVSEGCRFCYAETLSGRNPKTLGVWGPNGSRVVAAESAWREPVKWNKRAAQEQESHERLRRRNSEFDLPDPGPYQRPRVFCASLADVFEDWTGRMADSRGLAGHVFVDGEWDHGEWGWGPDRAGDKWNEDIKNARPLTMDDVRRRLFALIDTTPNLDWLLLTKRPENIARMLPRVGFPDAGVPGTLGRQLVLPNVWLGVSVEDQQRADERIPLLLQTPAAVRFLSVEPMLGPVDLTTIRKDEPDELDCLHGWRPHAGPEGANTNRVDWVIVGGESGSGARPFDIAWDRDLRDQCKWARVAFFFKQTGSLAYDSSGERICVFDSEQTWISKARSWLGGISGGGMRHERAPKHVCIDAKGRHCQIGRDFMRATSDNAYPVIVYPVLQLADRKGGDMEEWPEDLRIRQFPEVHS